MSANWINQLNASDSRLHKENIIGQALTAALLENEGAMFCLDMLRLCYDPYVTFGVRQIPETVGIVDAENPWDEFETLLGKLATRELSGHAARDAIQAIAEQFNSDEWNIFLAPVLRRDMRCGISSTTINKVCKNTKYAISVFGCQLATNSEGRPEMKGVKRLEPKLDGCLSANWTVEFEDGTKITIKEVVDQQIRGKVKSFNTITGKIEFNDITGWAKDGVDNDNASYDWFELEIENGKILPPLTGNHLIYLPKLKCYRRVDLLTTEDIILEDI